MSASNKPYVFISYAHRDSDAVLPVINAMQRSGINLWYDEGIAAGSEWPEYIAEKVMNCSKFLLFISNHYLDSQNCKREINFAISRKKDILSVYLEDVQLSPGMEMQLGTYQAFFKKRYPSTEHFCQALCSEGFFQNCREASAPQPQPAPQPQQGQQVDLNGVFNGFFGGTTQAKTGATEIKSTFNAYSDKVNHYVDDASDKVKAAVGIQPTTGLKVRSRIVAAVLALLLGSIGIHKFYLGQYLKGILYLVFVWTYIPAILALIECVQLLILSDAAFEDKYKCKAK